MKQLEQRLKSSWDEYLEIITDEKMKLNYKGDGTPRNVQDEKSGALFGIIYNSERDNRAAASVSGKNIPDKPKCPADCNLCTNILKNHSLLDNRGSYVVAPNKWPINRYHTLLVLNKDCPDAARQGELYASDLEAAMKFSKDTGQLLIYNTFGAAATQWHQHFQGFSYDSPIRKLKTIPLSADGVVHTIPEYAGGNFVFYGADKVAPAIELINKVRGMPSEYAYTVLFDEDQITVIPRRMEGETPACTQKKIGGFECSMVYVVGTTFSGKVVDKTGEEVFEQLGYEDLFKALQDATVPRDKFDNWYEQHPMYSQKSIPDRYVLQKVVTAGGR